MSVKDESSFVFVWLHLVTPIMHCFYRTLRRQKFTVLR